MAKDGLTDIMKGILMVAQWVIISITSAGHLTNVPNVKAKGILKELLNGDKIMNEQEIKAQANEQSNENTTTTPTEVWYS